MSLPTKPEPATPDGYDIDAVVMTNVYCRGCDQKRPINSVYAPYLPNGMESCRWCRDNGLPKDQD